MMTKSCGLALFIFWGILLHVVMVHSRQCKISEAYSRSTFDEKRIRDELLKSQVSSASWRPPVQEVGAVVSLFSHTTEAKIREEYPCQVENHQRYCDKHGYKCYIIGDRRRYAEERTKSVASGKDGFWMKFQVIKEILGSHPWVLFLDMDAIFNQPGATPSVEDLLAHSKPPQASSSVISPSVFMPRGEKVGWGTYFMLFRNTDWSHQFVEHLWSLRRVCPGCLGEQCAAHIALFDAIIRDVHLLVNSGHLSNEITVSDDQGKDCCHPVSLCRFPDYYRGSYRENYFASHNVQGCVWNWQLALRQAASGAVSSNSSWHAAHPHISWQWDMAGPPGLNLSHPVKQLTCLNGEYKHEVVLH